MARSIEFLIHYQCVCGWSCATGDRFPREKWVCWDCGKTNLEDDTTQERNTFAEYLQTWASGISESRSAPEYPPAAPPEQRSNSRNIY